MKNSFWDREVFPLKELPYERNRIPGMIVTQNGTLIIYNEARKSESDWAEMDIFMQRSEDGGKTFEEPIYLARGTKEINTVNNPVTVQDNNGRIHFLYCENYGIRGGRILHRTSDDDGKSWSEPIDITTSTLPDYRNAFALGPGHGICTQDGTLLVPVWLVPKYYASPDTSHVPSIISTLFSLDNGESWQLGEILTSTDSAISPNETSIACTFDGRIYLNARVHGTRRAIAYSENGYYGWSKLTIDKALIDPRCFGSCAAYDHNGKKALLFANCESENSRDHITVKLSLDNGTSWTSKYLISEKSGGYVEIAVDNSKGTIYVLYEEDFGKSCRLTAFDLECFEN